MGFEKMSGSTPMRKSLVTGSAMNNAVNRGRVMKE